MILRNCEIWYPHLDPARPNARFDKKRPQWDIQLRTQNKAQKSEWEAAGLKVKAVLPDDDSPPFYSTNLKRKSIKSNGEEAKCPDVIDGNLDVVDPRAIGNGSIGNIRVFQYTPPQVDANSAKIGNVLMGIQLTHHVVYVPQQRDPEEEFGKEETTVVGQAPAATEDDADYQANDKFAPETKTTPANSDKA